MNLDELVIKWKSIIHATRAIWSWTELEVLAYCAEVASKSKYMIECGSYLGKSAKVMLMANPELNLVCVDTFETAGLEHTFRHFLKDEIAEGRCDIIATMSDTASERLLNRFKPPFADAVWIDDGHASADLVRDITSFLPLLKPGGLIFGHDWDGDNDVARGVKSMIPAEKLTFPHPRVWQYKKP